MLSKKAYITLLSSEDYLDAILVLNESFKKVDSKYPLIIGITENLLTYPLVKKLERFDINYIPISRLEYRASLKEKCIKNNWISVLNTASKYSLFSLDYFEKLIYLDADSFVLKNIDSLMNYKDGSMLWEPYAFEAFSALYVFSPKNHDLELYTTLMNNLDRFDGDTFSKLWFHLKENKSYRIPLNYFFPFEAVDNKNYKKLKAVHFINERKPWKTSLEKMKTCNFCQENILNYYLEILDTLKER